MAFVSRQSALNSLKARTSHPLTAVSAEQEPLSHLNFGGAFGRIKTQLAVAER